MTIVLRPGQVELAEWRAVYRGAGIALHADCRAAIRQGALAVERIVARGEPVYGINTGFGKLASVKIDRDDLEILQRNIVLSHAAGVGEAAPAPIVRLMMALKLASLAQGASGVRPQTVAMLEGLLERGLIPVVPVQGSVGASGDLAPLAHMAAAMIGASEFLKAGRALPAAEALAQAGLAPLQLGPKEGLALLNGTQFSTAYALAALFEAEVLFQSALVAGALSTEAAKGSDTPFDPRIHRLRGHRGQIETAEAIRRLMAGSQIRASHLTDDARVQDPYCLRCQPQVMGAVLDLLRQAAATLHVESNGVSDNPLIFPASADGDDLVLSGGNFHGRAGRICRGYDRHRALRARFALGTQNRDAGRSGIIGPAGFPDAPARAQLRFHDPPGHRGGSCGREQAAGFSGERRLDPHERQPGGSRLHVRARGTPVDGHGR